MIVWLLLVLVLVIIFKFKLQESFTDFVPENLYNGGEWDSYRLGDIVLQPENSVFYDPNHNWNILYHTSKFPGSIASEYLEKNKPIEYANIGLLKKIISKRNKSIDIPNDTLVLHMRIGDSLCMRLAEDDAPDVYSKKGNVEWWNDIVKYIKKENITSVIIVSGTHFKQCLQESANYIMDRAKFLKKNGVSVQYRLGQPPDDDIIFCKNAKHFKSTGGGFGKLINMVN